MILPMASCARWLDSEVEDLPPLAELLTPFPADEIAC